MNPWFNKRWDNGFEMPILRVPLFTQPQTEPECLPHSLKMCIEYFKNAYPDHRIREYTCSLNRDEILKYIHVDDYGWIQDQTQLDDLSKVVGTLHFKLENKGTLGVIAKELSEKKPVIVIYDVLNLIGEGYGGVHAGVTVGLGESKIILNNPWRGAHLKEDLHTFKRAWEEADNAMIVVEIIKTPVETKLAEGN